MGIFDRLKTAASADWESYIDHAFVRQMSDGSLPQAAFAVAPGAHCVCWCMVLSVAVE